MGSDPVFSRPYGSEFPRFRAADRRTGSQDRRTEARSFGLRGQHSRKRSHGCRPRASSSPRASSRICRPGRSRSSHGIRSVRTRSTTPASSSRTSTSCTAIACMATTSPSSAARRGSTTRPSCSSAIRKAATPRSTCAATTACRKPEGYRKALRLMRLAERFRLPLITFIDTPGAYPGVGSEERNQSEAIARNLFEMSGHGHSHHQLRDRRGWLRRRAGHRRLRPAADAAVLHLLGDLARRLRVDPVEERGQEGSGGRRHEPHRRPAVQAQAGRRSVARAGRWRASQCRRPWPTPSRPRC